MLCYGQIFVRGATRDEVIAALLNVLRAEGYVPFEASRIPAGYPAERREFSHTAVAAPDGHGTVSLVLEDWDRAFPRAFELSRALPAATVVAGVRPPADPVRWKAYRAGEVVLKVGADPDDELFYNPVEADAEGLTAFVAAWTGGRGTSAMLQAEDTGRLLGLARAECGYREAVAGAWPVHLEVVLSISRRSRLHLEN